MQTGKKKNGTTWSHNLKACRVVDIDKQAHSHGVVQGSGAPEIWIKGGVLLRTKNKSFSIPLTSVPSFFSLSFLQPPQKKFLAVSLPTSYSWLEHMLFFLPVHTMPSIILSYKVIGTAELSPRTRCLDVRDNALRPWHAKTVLYCNVLFTFYSSTTTQCTRNKTVNLGITNVQNCIFTSWYLHRICTIVTLI